ncbi:hypothetical protein D3C79_1066880 [compost metagenome]
MSFPNIQCREVKNGRFFVDRTAVRKDCLGIKLQLVVVLEPQRFEQANIFMELHTHGVNPLLGTWVG